MSPFKRWRRKRAGPPGLAIPPKADRTRHVSIRTHEPGELTGTPTVGEDFWFSGCGLPHPIVGTLVDYIDLETAGYILELEVDPDTHALMQEILFEDGEEEDE